jgi:putative ABC transport system permease protein
MEFRPIISAMRRNKVGAVLIAVQIAITLAILCNALFIIQQRVAMSDRPTGIDDEASVVVLDNQWVGNPPDLMARQMGDLAALRSMPGVVDAYATNSVPLSDGGSSEGISLHPDQKSATARAALYFGDQHTIASLGLKLIAGRNFNSDEVTDKIGYNDTNPPASVIITKALADKLFPNANAVGQSIYDQSLKGQVPVVGVVDRLQVPWATGAWGSTFNDNSVIVPFHFAGPYPIDYVIHATPGQAQALIQAAPKKLFDISRARVIGKVRPMTALRKEIYKDEKGLVVILAVVCTALLAVTAFGIVGLTSYWVAQRRRQIGIRRALGATRNAIIQYFQTENLLIAGAGAAIGVALAVSLNLWMVNAFAMQRLNTGYTLIGAVVVMLLGQAAVLWPALKAASIPPALATRAA